MSYKANPDVVAMGSEVRSLYFVTQYIFIQRHISMGVGIGAKAARDEKWDYPLEALREAVVNAIVHRNYTDPGNIQGICRNFRNR